MSSRQEFKEKEFGIFAQDWKLDILKNRVDIIMGQSPPSKFYNNKGIGIPFMQGRKTFRDKYHIIDTWCTQPKRIAKQNSILISVRAPVGDLNIATTELCIGRGLSSVNMKNGNNEFLYYLLKNYKIRIISKETGTVFGSINKLGIENLKLPFPSEKEQERIASILSSLDEKIELNNQMNKNLEETVQAIFKHWFVDFEFPNENGDPYKSSGGEMIDSEMGPIPKDWKVRSLNQIANFLNGLAMQKYRPKNDESHLPVLKIKELKIGKTSKNSDKCSINIDPKYIVDNGDVVFSWSGSLEVKLWCGNKVGLNQHLFKVTSANYPKWFYYYWTKHHIEDFRRIAEDKTTTMGHIKREHLRKAKVSDPGKMFFEKFDKVIKGLIELYINNEKEIKYLSQLRDIILPKLMSGEIRVPVNDKEGDE